MTTWVVCDSDLGLCSGNIKNKKINCKFTLTIHQFIKRIVNQHLKKRLMKTKTFELFKKNKKIAQLSFYLIFVVQE